MLTRSSSSQLVGLRVKFGPVDVGADVAQVDGDAVDDVGDRVRALAVDEDFGGFGVDPQGEADDDGAEVEGADLAAVIATIETVGAVVGAGEVELAGGIGEDGADAGADQGAADFGAAGQEGCQLFGCRRLRVRVPWPAAIWASEQEGTPASLPITPGGSLIEKWVISCSASLAGERGVEGGVGAGGVVERAGVEVRVEGRRAAGRAGAACRGRG